MLILSPAAAPPFDGSQRESALQLAGNVTGWGSVTPTPDWTVICCVCESLRAQFPAINSELPEKDVNKTRRSKADRRKVNGSRFSHHHDTTGIGTQWWEWIVFGFVLILSPGLYVVHTKQLWIDCMSGIFEISAAVAACKCGRTDNYSCTTSHWLIFRRWQNNEILLWWKVVISHRRPAAD